QRQVNRRLTGDDCRAHGRAVATAVGRPRGPSRAGSVAGKGNPLSSNDVDLTAASSGPGEHEKYTKAQLTTRTKAGTATGRNGAVTVAYGAYAARAGLEALKQGGNAVDAALTAALTQVALNAGAPISYFGIMSLVYLD